jgi:hypothetical protein
LVTDESETHTITSRAMLPPASCFFPETQDASETNETDAATMRTKTAAATIPSETQLATRIATLKVELTKERGVRCEV